VVPLGETGKFTPLAVDPRATPPEATVYQLILLPVDIALKFDVSPSQTVEGVADMLEIAPSSTVTVVVCVATQLPMVTV